MKTVARSIVVAASLVSAGALSLDSQAAGGSGGGHGRSGAGHRGSGGGHGGSGGHGFGHLSGGHGGYRHGWGGVGLGFGIGTAGALGYYGAYGPYAPYYYDGYDGSAPAFVVSPGYAVPAGTIPVQQAGQPVPQAPRAPDPIFYPRNGQGSAMTEADRRECNRWAATQREALSDASVFQRATFACMEGRGYTVR